MGDVWKFANTDAIPQKYIVIRLLQPGNSLRCHDTDSTFPGSA